MLKATAFAFVILWPVTGYAGGGAVPAQELFLLAGELGLRKIRRAPRGRQGQGVRVDARRDCGGGQMQRLIFAALMFWLGMNCGAVFAEEGHTHEGALGKFYSTWMMPDAPKVSCCSDQDCSPTASRFVNNRWEAERNGLWFPVPPNKVEQNRDSPDGRSHLCGRPGPIGEFTVFCFVRGGGA